MDYNEFYNTYDKKWRSLCAENKASELKFFLEKVKEIYNNDLISIIDFGAGDGAVQSELKKTFDSDKYWAAEYSKKAVEMLRATGNYQQVYQIDNENIRELNKNFNLVLACHVLEHVYNPDTFLENIGSISEYQLIEVPLEDTFFLNSNIIDNGTGHVNFYNPNTLVNYLLTRDFIIISHKIYLPSLEIHRVEGPILGAIKWLIKRTLLSIAPRIATMIFSYHMIVLTKKKST